MKKKKERKRDPTKPDGTLSVNMKCNVTIDYNHNAEMCLVLMTNSTERKIESTYLEILIGKNK